MKEFEIEEIKTRTLKDKIYDVVKMSVLKNEFPAGNYITESELAIKLNVSRTPLREAMQELVSEDLIEFKPRKGYKQKYHTLEEIYQIFKLRLIIEKEIIEPLLNNIKDEDIKILKHIVEKQKDATAANDQYLFMNLDKEFHRKMFLISNYNIFLKAYDIYHNLTVLIGTKAISNTGRMEKVIEEHEKIILSIKNKNSKQLESAIEEHLKTTKETFINKRY